jgi:hypothetical protein
MKTRRRRHKVFAILVLLALLSGLPAPWAGVVQAEEETQATVTQALGNNPQRRWCALTRT